jgi:ribonucleoside-diphosphate reductase beta chain
MILNRNNVPIQEQKLFLGPELALQRYDQFKHPVFFELFNKQLGFMWRPEEISLQKDRVDYQSLADHEKHIFTSNLLFQTLMDSVVSRGVTTFSKYITSPELEACFNVWQMFETIHSYSYTYIIKNLYPNPTELLDQALLNPAIQERIDSVCQSYDDLATATEDNVKARIYLALISVNILEAVRFYVSFVCAFAFAENKKMVGNADIIRLIKRDELLHLRNTQSILDILHKDESEGFIQTAKDCREQAIEMFVKAAAEEKEWAKYLFKDGSILGLNEVLLSQYIEWLTDTRMTNIGLPKQFHVKNNGLGGWVLPWMESTSVQVAPQESEITNYKIGASTSDVDSMDLSGVEL